MNEYMRSVVILCFFVGEIELYTLVIVRIYFIGLLVKQAIENQIKTISEGIYEIMQSTESKLDIYQAVLYTIHK